MTDEPSDDAPPRWRSFVAQRLDRNRWSPVSTNAGDDEIDEVLREGGYDPATRKEMKSSPEDPRTECGDDEGGNSMVRHRWVRVMADLYADGVWNQDGESCLVDDLPVAPRPSRRILAWQDWYEETTTRRTARLIVPPSRPRGLRLPEASRCTCPIGP